MYAVVLAGGGGTRLWPLSTPECPKPFLRLIGDETLIQRSVARLAPLVEPADVYVVTDRRYCDLVREQLPGIPAANFLGEPMGRNTAAAVAFAAEAIDRPADEVMLVLPADAHIADEAGLRAALAVAGEVAAGGSLVTLGVTPDRPETGYGYILARPPARVVRGRDTYAVDRFVEKPTAERANEFIATRLASWNAGIFVWTRSAIRDRLSAHAPEIVGPIRAIGSSGTPKDLDLAYPSLRSTSIDYAVMEPASLEGAVAVVPIDVGWSDLGSWAALRDAWQEERRVAASRAPAVDAVVEGAGVEGAGAVGIGNMRDLGSSNSLVLAGERLVVTIGLEDIIVVDTPDALLVCSADHSQEVRTIAEEMAASGKPASSMETKP